MSDYRSDHQKEMRSMLDEIASLRTHLDDILWWCHNTATHTSSDVERATCNHLVWWRSAEN